VNSVIDRSFRTVLLAPILLLVTQFGCQGSAEPAAPELARQTLSEALDAWQSGEMPEAFRERSSITVVEPKWKAGFRLLEFEVIGNGEMSGFDWQCRVRLSLQNAGGKKMQERAIYSISTSPALVIVRSES
jgi:hypothetical protein